MGINLVCIVPSVRSKAANKVKNLNSELYL